MKLSKSSNQPPIWGLLPTWPAKSCELRAADDAADAGFYRLDQLPGPIAFAAHRKVLRALGADLEDTP